MAQVEVAEASRSQLAEYAAVPIAFRGNSVYRVNAVDEGLGGFRMTEERVEPFEKNHDALETPQDWPERFDLSRWGIFLARADGAVVGGAAVAFDTSDVLMLEGRRDVSCLWDLRVRPEWRGKGVGFALFQEAVRWSKTRGCRWMKVETQNNNVQACRFYVRQGCCLGRIDLHAYDRVPACADEVMLIWYCDLEGA